MTTYNQLCSYLLRKYLIPFCVVLALIASLPAYADIVEQFPLETKQQQQQFHQLLDELRCLVCQNQNLLDSNATLAVDLKKKIYLAVQQHQSSEQIKAFLRSRYGDFILFRPPVNRTTWVLWFAPFLMLCAGIVVLCRLLLRGKD